jgi:hypothetical protein
MTHPSDEKKGPRFGSRSPKLLSLDVVEHRKYGQSMTTREKVTQLIDGMSEMALKPSKSDRCTCRRGKRETISSRPDLKERVSGASASICRLT